jgi:peroxiredoxin family protein
MSDITQIDGMSPEEWFSNRFDQKMAEREKNKTPKLSMLVSHGTLDAGYPPFIIGSTAAALGWDVSIFFTFYGLALLKNDLKLHISALGNPAMPMNMPFGPEWFKNITWNIPNLVMANVPWFENIATGLMKQTLKGKGVASIEDLRDACVEMDVEIIACQMTVDLFRWKKEDFFDGVSEWAGAATYLSKAADADVTLFL